MILLTVSRKHAKHELIFDKVNILGFTTAIDLLLSGRIVTQDADEMV